MQGRRQPTERQRHQNGAPTRWSKKSDCGKAAGQSARPTHQLIEKLPEQRREKVEHIAGRSAEPAEACGTQLERVLDTDSSDNEQVGDGVHQIGQLKVPEKDGEEHDVLEHCVQV